MVKMSNLSYSFHICKDKNAIKTKSNLVRCSNHNMRVFCEKQKNNYDKTKNVILVGSSNIYKDVEQLYHKEFDVYVKEFNKKEKKKSRRFDDYFEKINNSKNTHLATEIIIQIGNIDEQLESRDAYISIYKNQIEKLNELLPDFKIANAVIHFDETTPHMHIVGVGTSFNERRLMKKEVAKSKLFNKESLSMLQDKMREIDGLEFKQKEKWDNDYLTVDEYIKQKDVRKKFILQKQKTIEEIKNESISLENKKLEDEKRKKEYEDEIKKLEEKKKEAETKLKKLEDEYKQKEVSLLKSLLIKIQNLFKENKVDVEKIKQKKETLNNELLELEKSIKDLKEKNKNLEIDISKLTNKKTELDNSKSGLENEIKILEIDKTELNTKISNLKTEIGNKEELKKELENLKNDYDFYKNNKDQIIEDVRNSLTTDNDMYMRYIHEQVQEYYNHNDTIDEYTINQIFDDSQDKINTKYNILIKAGEVLKNNIFNHREYYNRMDIDDFVNIYQECKDDIVDKLINDNVDEFVEQQQKNKKKGMRM